MDQNPKGLCQLIREAESNKVVDRLLDEGKRYESASDMTRRRWSSCAERRVRQLQNAPKVEAKA